MCYNNNYILINKSINLYICCYYITYTIKIYFYYYVILKNTLKDLFSGRAIKQINKYFRDKSFI